MQMVSVTTATEQTSLLADLFLDGQNIFEGEAPQIGFHRSRVSEREESQEGETGDGASQIHFWLQLSSAATPLPSADRPLASIFTRENNGI